MHKDMEVNTWLTSFDGTLIFIDFKKHTCPLLSRLLHKICAGANFRLVMGCFNEVIWGRRTVRGDKDSISGRSGVNLHTATYQPATAALGSNCLYSGLLLPISLRIRLFDLTATTVLIDT